MHAPAFYHARTRFLPRTHPFLHTLISTAGRVRARGVPPDLPSDQLAGQVRARGVPGDQPTKRHRRTTRWSCPHEPFGRCTAFRGTPPVRASPCVIWPRVRRSKRSQSRPVAQERRSTDETSFSSTTRLFSATTSPAVTVFRVSVGDERVNSVTVRLAAL